AQGIGYEPGGDRERRPQIREDAAGDELPRGGPEREPKPGTGDHRAGDRVARLRFQVAQRHEPSERDSQQHLRALGTEAYDAAERLQVAEQLAEARQMSGPPPGAAVAPQVQQV